MKIELGKQSYPVIEPVFKKLRLIMAAQAALAEPDCTAAEQYQQLLIIISNLVSKKHAFYLQRKGLRALTHDQTVKLLTDLPALCGLDEEPQKPKRQRFSTVDPFDRIYARLGLLFGWTWEYIDEHMTMTRYHAIEEQLAYTPPVDELVAAYLDYKPNTLDAQAEAFEKMIGIF